MISYRRCYVMFIWGVLIASAMGAQKQPNLDMEKRKVFSQQVQKFVQDCEFEDMESLRHGALSYYKAGNVSEIFAHFWGGMTPLFAWLSSSHYDTRYKHRFLLSTMLSSTLFLFGNHFSRYAHHKSRQNLHDLNLLLENNGSPPMLFMNSWMPDPYFPNLIEDYKNISRLSPGQQGNLSER